MISISVRTLASPAEAAQPGQHLRLDERVQPARNLILVEPGNPAETPNAGGTRAR